MPQLIVKSENIRSTVSLISAALKTQLNVIATGIKRTRMRIKYFETTYEFSTAELLEKETLGTLDDSDLEIIEWLGEYRMLERLEAEYRELVGLEICS